LAWVSAEMRAVSRCTSAAIFGLLDLALPRDVRLGDIGRALLVGDRQLGLGVKGGYRRGVVGLLRRRLRWGSRDRDVGLRQSENP
jgi:hypothetical protein